MKSTNVRLLAINALCAGLLLSPSNAGAQQIKSRLMVLLDTSGSMGFHFTDPAVFCDPAQGCNPDYPGGDGSTAYTGPIGSAVPNWSAQGAFPIDIYPGKLVNNVRDGVNSRLYAAKGALTDAINAYAGNIDFGLSTYDFQFCAFTGPLCSQCTVQCVFNQCNYSCVYTDNAFTKLVATNWESQGCTGPGLGGRLIVNPGTGSGAKILPWVDGIETFQDSKDGNATLGTGGGTPINPELRAEGNTPLGEAINVVKSSWYTPVLNAAANSANYDAQLNCRPYVVVVETDGGQSYDCAQGIKGGAPGPGNPCCNGDHCNAECGVDPAAAVQSLYNLNPNNPVLTYVIGLSITDQADLAQLNGMAVAGGTGSARLANSQAQIEAAYADILAKSVKTEVCNGKDDNCNQLIDEGLGVYEECTQNAQCPSGACSGGRCTCANGAQCANGYSCENGFCQPSCTVGVGACQRVGARKCGMNGNAVCCVNDNLSACTPLVAGTPGPPLCVVGADNNCNGILDTNEMACPNPPPAMPETCNGVDDDLDGVIDDNLTDTGKSCGFNVGQCKAGTTICVNSNNQNVQNGGTPDKNDKLICQGQVPPAAEACNGCDNNCDGVVDAPTQSCYTGPMGTDNVGICHGGTQRCTAMQCPQAAQYGTCLGQQLPTTEVCNGLDDDCNGKVDDVPGAGVACCPSGKCGVGACVAGTEQCSGGALSCIGGQGPVAEVCNGIDDDCNGKIDDLPNIGQACAASNGCPGTLQCDAMKMVESCVATQQNCQMGPCNNDPRVGKACGAGMGLPAPCMAGTFVCTNGQVVCQGGVAPTTEVCDCIDNDCNGKIDDGAFCPGGTACVMCACVGPCGGGEFPCMSGFDCAQQGATCTRDSDCPTAMSCIGGQCSGYCVPNGCNPACANGLICKNGQCTDPCAGVNCGVGSKCVDGFCMDTTCRGNPSLCKTCANGSGQRCDITQTPPACVTDLCCGNTCNPASQICNPTNGMCVDTCAKTKCPAGSICQNGACMLDPCANRECPAGQLCDPSSGSCVANQCAEASCSTGQVCCQNQCQIDPCASITCPTGSRCAVNVFDCTPDCELAAIPPNKQDQVMTTGGGGFAIGCSVGGAGNAGSPASSNGLGLLFVAGALLFSIRRRRWLGQASVVALPLLGSLLLAGCNVNPFCLNCGQGADGDVTTFDLTSTTNEGDMTEGPDLATEPDLMNPDGGCSPNLMIDPNNCGSCGHQCQYAHAGGKCQAGQCALGTCLQGWYDLDKNPANGCEYSCTPTPPTKCATAKDCSFGLACNNALCAQPCVKSSDCPQGTVCDPDTNICEGEYCDGVDNNCNGETDEGFNLKSDVNNCGACNALCSPPNATAECAAGVCAIAACKTDGKGGRYYDLDKSEADGCEYDCPADPPRAEVCNGVDDDCNGIIDDNPKDVGQACDDYCPALAPCVAQGNCAYPTSACKGKCCGVCTEGVSACVSGQKICTAGVQPKLEVCNGLDDNCDGQIDEGFNVKIDPLNCGMCGNACDKDVNGGDGNAIWGCAAGACLITNCKLGFADLDKNAANGCEYTCPVNPPTAETCNGKDDDCNGQVDDNLTAPQNFCVQTSICMGAQPVCCGASGWLCNYPSINANIEVSGNAVMCQGGQMGGNLVFSEARCDGFDGNCNGMIDESFLNKGKSCTAGVGACQGTSTYVCNAMQNGTTCPATANPQNAVDEQCNGIDDDCDGQTDERTPVNGTMCTNGGVHACKGWIDPAVKVGAVWFYEYEASRVDSTANAQGVSTARSCSKPGVLPWASITQAQAQAACAAVADSAGKPMRLCTAPEWSGACDIGETATWSYATNANTAQPTTCNGADAGFNTAWASGSGAMCYANQANGKIYDMSGNVAEWTSTSLVVNGTTYYKVRGGTFNDFIGGLKCDFDFQVLGATYLNSDIGFRCCSDDAP